MNVIYDLTSNNTLKSSFYEINDVVQFFANVDELEKFSQQLITIFGSTCEIKFFKF